MKQKHPHYQEIQAYANCWGIELKTESGVWIGAANPCFYAHRQYRIVPDAEGWLPHFAHKDSECPVDGGQMIEVESDTGVRDIDLGSMYIWASKHDSHQITRYRLVEDHLDIDELVETQCIQTKKPDEYVGLKEAHERGETIQIPFDQGWVDTEGEPSWSLPAEQYRIKPKTKKLWQWIIKDNSVPEEPYYYLTEMFYATRDELEEFLVTRTSEVFQKANWTMIEVEDCEVKL